MDYGRGHSIIEVDKNTNGEIIAYKLDNGETLEKTKAVELAKQGYINGVQVSVSKKGEEYLRSLPDGSKSNNLSSMPEFD